MRKIYICDDELIYREHIKQTINGLILEKELPFALVESYSTAEALLECPLENSQSIYFLDVNLKTSSMDGFQLGQKIRQIDSKATLIYVTTYEELAIETFRYRLDVFDYLVKDQPKDLVSDLKKVMLRLVENAQPETLSDNNELFLIVKFGDELIKLSSLEILYIESSHQKHKVNIQTLNQRIETFETLKDIETKLPDFIRVHRSYLVNPKQIQKVNTQNNTLTMQNGDICLLSRRLKKTVKAFLN